MGYDATWVSTSIMIWMEIVFLLSQAKKNLIKTSYYFKSIHLIIISNYLCLFFVSISCFALRCVSEWRKRSSSLTDSNREQTCWRYRSCGSFMCRRFTDECFPPYSAWNWILQSSLCRSSIGRAKMFWQRRWATFFTSRSSSESCAQLSLLWTLNCNNLFPLLKPSSLAG